LVPIDFDNQDIGEALKAAGYVLSAKTLFIWEGVTQYISRESIDNTLKYVAQAARGSRIVFSYVLNSFIDGSNIPKGLSGLYNLTINKDNPIWLCGFNPDGIVEYLSKYSLHVIEDVGHREYLERYLNPRGRYLTAMEIERVVLAELK